MTLAGRSNSPQRVPFVYALDMLERRYGQPPGSAATWEPEVLLRALAFLEAEVGRG